jgi:tetrahydromethanopterin S-methyltransferase subunit G
MPFSWRRIGALMLPLLMVLALVPAAFAQSEERVRELERQVEQLKAEIAAMKGSGDADRLSELERRLEVLAGEIEKMKIGEAAATADQSSFGLGPAASKIYRAERGVSIGGYGELRYQDFDSDESSELDLLRAVLYFGYKWNDRWVFNSEVEYEHAGEEIALEFAYLDYLWRPQANFRAGLVLIPMGFVNELHEPTVFLGANRPELERQILPSTWRENGFGLFGDAGPFTYRTYLVNGFDATGFTARGLRGGRQNGVETKADDFAWVGRLDFTGVPGLLVGGSAYVGNAGQDLESARGDSIDVGTTIYEGHLEWRWRGLELRALGVQADLDDVADLNAALGFSGNQSIGESIKGYYLQLGYDVLSGRAGGTGGRALIPYARLEAYNTQDEVPAGFRANPANDVETLTLGLAFKPFEQIILKTDFQNIDNEAGTGVDQFNVVLGYVF